jgi:signal transduction histidine kinase
MVAELLNLVGLSSGIALYAMLLLMVLRSGRSRDSPEMDPLLLATAVLGLVWNLCALPAYELPKLGLLGPVRPLVVFGYSALGFLPAVVVHSVMRGEPGRRRPWARRAIACVAYGVSLLAALLHVTAWIQGQPLPSLFGMRLLTYTYVLLVVPLAAVTRGQPGSRRTLWAVALAIFAVSALHLSQLHTGDASWPVELLGHHASLPLALAILYQDFPFALADLFLKRALTLVALVAAAFIAVASMRLSEAAGAVDSARDVAILVTLWVATALLYPALRRAAAWFVDQVVLHRPDYASLRAALADRAQRHDEIPALLDDACAQLAPAFSARVATWRQVGLADDEPRAAAVISIDLPVAEPPRFALEIGPLTGGRRLLSDDRAALDAIASTLARRIDTIRLARERFERQIREQETERLAAEAELRALRSQINPHFLFNALTTVGYLTQTAPDRAFDTLMRLTALLRGILRFDDALTTLGRELDLVQAYLDIERARFDERLRVRIDVEPALRAVQLPPLILQPLVENAVKHGIAPLQAGGEVSVVARLEAPGRPGAAPVLSVAVHDTGAGATHEQLRRGRKTGVGLQNVERRLECHYGSGGTLMIDSTPGIGTTVHIRVPAQPSDLAAGRARGVA